MKYLILTQIKIIGYNFKILIIFSLWDLYSKVTFPLFI